jgi:hypothetical protein
VPDTDPWAWATAPARPSFCLTYLHHCHPLDLLTSLGTNPARTAPLTAAETVDAYPYDTHDVVLRCGQLGAWAWCYEDRRFTANRHEHLTRLSTGTTLLQIVKAGDGTNAVRRHTNGRRIESFDPGNPTNPRGEGPYELLHRTTAYLAEHPHTSGITAALHVIGDLTGGHLDENTINGPLLTSIP